MAQSPIAMRSPTLQDRMPNADGATAGAKWLGTFVRVGCDPTRDVACFASFSMLEDADVLIRLIYASRTAGVLAPLDVHDIVQRSQRNNRKLGVTGALLLSNGIFLQCLEGDHIAVNALYHRILLDKRHHEPAILSFSEIDQRLYGAWSMGLVTSTEANQRIFLKYSPQAEFDPYQIRGTALNALFAEMVEHARLLPA
jgi:hypothetical protein